MYQEKLYPQQQCGSDRTLILSPPAKKKGREKKKGIKFTEMEIIQKRKGKRDGNLT